MSSSLTFSEIRSFDEVAGLQSEWDRLAKLHRWPMAELHWVRACAASLPPAGRPSINVVLRDGALAAVAALVAADRLAAPLATVGATALHEAMPLLSDGPDATVALLEGLAQLRRPLVLSRTLEPERYEEQVQRTLARRGRLFTLRAAGSPYLPLPDSPQAFADSLSSGRRNELQRKRRKLEARGAVTFESDFPDEHTVLADLDEFARLEDAGWKGRQGSSILRRPGLHAYFGAGLPEAARRRRVRIDRLKLSSDTIAMQFGLASDGRYFLFKPTFDERLSALSPGSILTFEAIKQSIVEGLESYEFLGSADEWKLRWTNVIRSTVTWVFYPYSAVGALRLGLDALGTATRRISARVNTSRRRLA